MGEETGQGITRRDLLRRGAVLGGAVVWTTPVVQTLGMGRAFANAASPVPCTPDISFIALCVTDPSGKKLVTKFDVEHGGIWDKTDGNAFCKVPCEGAEGFRGDSVGFGIVIGPDGCATLTVPAGWTVDAVTVFGGNICDQRGSQSDGSKLCCPKRTS